MENEELKMEMQVCHNCKKEIPQNNYLMHVAHCARNMAVCPVCGDAVPKSHLKDHKIQQHSIVECKDCRFKVQSGAMEHHKTTACGKRIMPCAHCELELPKSDMEEHENYCGSRTERCDDCGELVMLKYKKLHLDTNHGFLKLDDEPGPLPSWELPPARRQSSLDLGAVAASLPFATERNVNTVPSTNKTDYKTTLSNDATREQLRSYVLPYDTTEDLRAKVKLARHDLNEIKQSFLMTEDKKEKLENKYTNDNLNLTAPNEIDKTHKTTNFFPRRQSYEMNKTAPLPSEGNPKNYYNYLGEKEIAPKNPIATSYSAHKNLLSDSSILKDNNKIKKNRVKDLHNFENSEPSFDSNLAVSPTRNVTVTGALPKTSTTPKKELGAVPRSTRRKAPPPPVNIPKAVVDVPIHSPDEVNLPCEFCDKMVQASLLVQHETGCRPDLTQYRPDNQPSSLLSCTSASPDVQLPCEFCFSLFPASKLLSHQAQCDV